VCATLEELSAVSYQLSAFEEDKLDPPVKPEDDGRKEDTAGRAPTKKRDRRRVLCTYRIRF